MKDTFSTYHPAVNFIYFVSVICFSFFFMHPAFLIISFVSGMIYSIYLNGRKAVKFNILFMIPMFLFFAIVNPAFNHAGATILVYVNDNPITLEAIIFGISSAAMFVTVIIWFSCYNSVMTSDKFIYLFGRIIPALSLILSMVLRFVPKYKNQIKTISNAQKCIGRDVGSGNIFRRIKNGINILSIFITWALENSIETADSMKSRGYGLKGRTSYSLYRLTRRDMTAIFILILLIATVIIGSFLGENNITYFPVIIKNGIKPMSFLIYTAYGMLCLFPFIIDVMEDIRW